METAGRKLFNIPFAPERRRNSHQLASQPRANSGLLLSTTAEARKLVARRWTCSPRVPTLRISAAFVVRLLLYHGATSCRINLFTL